jgi:hypothetical protein
MSREERSCIPGLCNGLGGKCFQMFSRRVQLLSAETYVQESKQASRQLSHKACNTAYTRIIIGHKHVLYKDMGILEVPVTGKFL